MSGSSYRYFSDDSNTSPPGHSVNLQQVPHQSQNKIGRHVLSPHHDCTQILILPELKIITQYLVLFNDCFGLISARRIEGRGAWGWSYFVDAPKRKPNILKCCELLKYCLLIDFWRGLTGNLSEDGLISDGEKKKLLDHGAKVEKTNNSLQILNLSYR